MKTPREQFVLGCNEIIQEYNKKGQSEELRQWMRYMVQNDIFFLAVFVCDREDINRDWLYDRCNEVQRNPDGYLDIWAREHYKENPIDTPIFTPDGWRLFGDLEVGDYVYSPNGNHVKVLARTDIQSDPVQYEVQFETFQGDVIETIQAGSQHLWDVISCKRTVDKDYWEEERLNTQQMYDYTSKQKKLKRKRWIRVPYASALKMKEKDLPIDPYTLGVWLGDGSCGSSAITNGNNEIISRLEGKITTIRKVGKTKVFAIHGLIGKLKELGLGDVRSETKFIPSIYLEGSIEQRLELLRGLMDTDGGLDTKGRARFNTTSKEMAKNVMWLVRSLGEVPHLHEGTRQYVVTFSAKRVDCFTISHHKKRVKDKALDYNYWYIKDVRRVESKPSRCIQVEGGRYLIGEHLIPTHNSTIITWLKTMQDILINPEERICIYSYNQTLAKSFVAQIKTELETNWTLKWLFPEILWEDPLKGTYLDENGKRQRIPWTTDSIRVKRKSRAKEDTLTASGLVTGQKTGGHYTILIYDDVVTIDSVTSPDMIERTTEAFQMSLNTGANSPDQPVRIRIIGTRYHYADTYSVILKNQTAIPRIYPCVDELGNPVLLSKEVLAAKKRDLGSWVFASQMMCDPRQSSNMGFLREWIKPWVPIIWENLNRLILIDPADKVKRKTDYTVMWVVGLGADRNYYVIDVIRDKLTLTSRTNALFALHQKYRPQLGTFYEEVGMQADIQHIEEQMALRNYRFSLYPVKATSAKGLRIEALEPIFRQQRIYMPDTVWRKNWEGNTVNIIEEFILEEYLAYPYARHDDMLDALSKLTDDQVVPFLSFPDLISSEELLRQRLGATIDAEEPYRPF